MLQALLFLTLHLPPVSPALPNLQPQLAAARGLTVLTFASGDTIRLARSTDGGRTWSEPAQVAVLPKLLARRHRGPRAVIIGNTVLVTAIATGSDLYCWRSTDGGRTWSKPAVVNDVPKSAEEGLDAIAADADGHVAAAWLDDRIAGGKRLWGAFSNDAGATWSKNVMLYESPSGTICQCCHPSLVALGHGDFAVMWRNAIDGSRDFYVLRLHDGKPEGAAAKQGEGTWKIDACPMDGGGIVLDHGSIVTAWRREHNIFLARPGERETDLGAGQDVALAEGREGPIAIWVQNGAIVEQGHRLADHGAFPAIVALPSGGLLAAWEENGTIATRRIE
jgi:hypothetical protein